MASSWAQSGRLTVAKISGRITADEFFDIVFKFFKSCTPDMVIDLSEADLCSLSSADLKWALEHSTDRNPDCPKKRAEAGGIGIWIGGEDLQYGLGRMIEVFAEMLEYHVPIYVVRTPEEALKILAVGIGRRMKRILIREGLMEDDKSICK